jgi:hypothetical protein
MTFWHRAPREVYRVYGQDEYLAEDDAHAAEESWPPLVGEEPRQSSAHDDPASVLGGIDPDDVGTAAAYRDGGLHRTVASSRSHGSRSGRLVGLGVLVGVTVGALGLVALNATHRSPAAPRVVVAQTTHAGAAAHASVDAPISHRSVVGMSNGPASRMRAPARARTRASRHSSAGSAGGDTNSSAGSASAGSASAGSAGGDTTVAPTSAESASKATSAESAQPPQPTTSEPTRPGAPAPPIDGEFEFER